jgi:hypothetical protein
MTTMRLMSFPIIAGLLIAGNSSAQEKRIKRSDLPAVVEVEMIVNGHIKDVQIEPSGNVTEVEEEVTMNSLSAEVKAGLAAKAGDGRIVRVESLTKKEKIVAYEAKVDTAGKKSEIQVDPVGKPLDHEE